MSIKAIETRYKGYRFRSRLEARWAVFLDALGVSWEYERQGYSLPSGPYLPDFWLAGTNAWLEIKPGDPSPEEREKISELVEMLRQPAAIVFGPPEDNDLGLVAAVAFEWVELDEWQRRDMAAEPGEYGGAVLVGKALQVGGMAFRHDPITFNDLFTDRDRAASEYSQAVAAARSARFEHGETPVPPPPALRPPAPPPPQPPKKMNEARTAWEESGLPPPRMGTASEGLAIGSRVRHEQYGEGVVIDLSGFGATRTAKVRFARDGIILLRLQFARLEVLP